MESEDESTSSGSTVEDEQVSGPSRQAVDFGAAEYVLPESESNEIYMNSESADESEGSDSEEEADERSGGSDEAVHSNSQGEENSSEELSDSENEDVQWDWTSTSNYQATVENFDDTASGLRHRMDEFSSPLDIFRTVFNDEAMDLVVSETNRYADQTGDCLTKRWEKWRSVDSTEMMRFFAVRMLMGINNKPKLSHYWSRDPIFRQTLIPEIMARDRYFEISRNLHFSNNDDQPPGDRLFKINAIWGLVMKHFSSLIEPGEKLSVDESLILYKGRLHFKQYIPSKRSRFGVKTFTIVDEKTKFLINSIIYSGKGHLLKYSKKEFGYGGAIALELISPYMNSNRRLYCDNWFTSPLLAKRLLDKKTYMCGTLRKTRKDAPNVSGKMKKGEVEAYHSNGVLVELRYHSVIYY